MYWGVGRGAHHLYLARSQVVPVGSGRAYTGGGQGEQSLPYLSHLPLAIRI